MKDAYLLVVQHPSLWLRHIQAHLSLNGFTMLTFLETTVYWKETKPTFIIFTFENEYDKVWSENLAVLDVKKGL